MMGAGMFRVMAWLAIAGLAAGCGRAAPTARNRVLASLPGDLVTVVVADARAIAHPRIRGVLDVLAARWPSRMACVLEAAYAGEQVALAVDRGGNVTAVVATAARPSCAALSQRAPGLWVATIGAGPSAAGSLADDERFARARPYLASAPIAAASLGAFHVLATAQPDPLEAWLAIDEQSAPDADALEMVVAAQVVRMQRDAATSAIASRLHSSRNGAQIIVRLDGPVDGDLAVVARTLLAWLDERARPAAARFACPAPAPGITCEDGTRYHVASLAGALTAIVGAGRPAPIVANGLVAGLRLDAPVAPLGLAAGDVVLAVGGRLVTSRAMLADRVAHARGETTVTIRRGTTEKVLQFAEP
jgi:hypothetical protein